MEYKVISQSPLDAVMPGKFTEIKPFMMKMIHGQEINVNTEKIIMALCHKVADHFVNIGMIDYRFKSDFIEFLLSMSSYQ